MSCTKKHHERFLTVAELLSEQTHKHTEIGKHTQTASISNYFTTYKSLNHSIIQHKLLVRNNRLAHSSRGKTRNRTKLRGKKKWRKTKQKGMSRKIEWMEWLERETNQRGECELSEWCSWPSEITGKLQPHKCQTEGVCCRGNGCDELIGFH